MDRYTGLAEVYDRFMSDYGYDERVQYYLNILKLAGCDPKTICECACGTGSMSIRFAGKGIRVIASDLSEEMLRAATVKARGAGRSVLFAQQDMTRLSVGRKVDALVCCCDGVNYLLTQKQLLGFAAASYAALRPGGVLAFDVSTRYKLEKEIGDGFFGEDRENMAYLWSNRWDAEQGLSTMELTFFVQTEGDRFRRFTEQHIQRAYLPEELAAALTETGFDNIRFYGDMTFEAPGEQEKRIHITAVKPMTEGKV